ncbi:sigma factor, partial [Spirillospora sp. NPDC049652]
MKLTFSIGTGADDATGRHARVRRRGRSDPWPAEPLWPAPDPVRDRALLLDLVAREEGAVATLYDAYAARLHDYAASVLHDGPAADVVHDVLVDAARRAARVRDRERLGAWLYGATR